MTAARTGDDELVETLIAARADVNAKDNDDHTPLMYWVINSDSSDVIHSLIRCGADIAARDKGGWTALMYAAENGHTNCIDALIAAGSDASISTALILAARDDQPAAITTLIADKADKDATDSDGWSPLMYAAYHGHIKSVDALISVGANVNVRGNSGATALSCAMSGNDGKGYPDVIAALKAAGATQ
jgi:ankyrin repeat protein